MNLKKNIMKEIEVHEIELAEYIESKLDEICFIVSPEGSFVAYMFNEYYETNKEIIEKAIQESGYSYCDYQVNDVI